MLKSFGQKRTRQTGWTGCVDRTPTHNTHLCSTVCSQARNAHHALGSSHADCSIIFCAREKSLSSGVAHVSPFVFLSPAVYHEHIIFLIHSSTTQEHAAQSVQSCHLQEHPAHHEHLQALPGDKLRHQESLWRENLQSGGNPRTTTSTGYEPKELATVSRNEDYPGDPDHVLMHSNFWENKITELRSPKK